MVRVTRRKILFVCGFLLASLGWAPEAAAQVMISELLPDPAAASDRSEWVELYNYSDQDVDLAGWSIDNKPITVSMTIAAHGFLTLTKDSAAFATEFGTVTNVFQHVLSLSNSGDTVILTDGAGYSDSVSYTTAHNNRSWERPGLTCMELSEHESGHTLNTTNSNNDPLCFAGPSTEEQGEVELSLDNSTWENTFTVLGPAQVYFRYISPAGSPEEVRWFLDDGTEISNPTTFRSLGTQGPSGITRTVSALNADNQEVESASFTIFPKLVVTEYLPNPKGTDSGNEWIEVFNPNAFSVSLSDVLIQDESGEVVSLADFGFLDAGEYLQVKLPKPLLKNCVKSSCTDAFTLLYQSLVIDTISYQDSKEGVPWCLLNQTWIFDCVASPGVANASGQSANSSSSSSTSSAAADSSSASNDTSEDLEYSSNTSASAAAATVLSSAVDEVSPFRLPSLTLQALPEEDDSINILLWPILGLGVLGVVVYLAWDLKLISYWWGYWTRK